MTTISRIASQNYDFCKIASAFLKEFLQRVILEDSQVNIILETAAIQGR